ncbi:MAG TPA: hypothetical protein VFU81_18285, partial [Thermomicrobiales bacterium]|nr:hypothetical protein [Thermomicrobiales bacterium]
MDESRFDEERCGLGETGSGRRGVLKASVAGGLAAALGRVTGRPAAKARQAKKGKGPCGKCGTFCEPRTAAIFCDPTNDACNCFRSTSGKAHCGHATDADCPAFGEPDKCQRDADCGPDAICVKTLGGLCCNQAGQAQVNICVSLCTAAT